MRPKHTEPSTVEGETAEIGRDPRKMTAEELTELGHQRRPLLRAIRANCVECCAGLEAEVRRCRMSACPMWPYRMGTNPFSKREYTEEQRAALAERFRLARERGETTEDDEPLNE
jgi:hypothetical protein